MQQRPGQPSCFDRMKMGFMIGFAVGISSAGLFGTYSALRYISCQLCVLYFK